MRRGRVQPKLNLKSSQAQPAAPTWTRRGPHVESDAGTACGAEQGQVEDQAHPRAAHSFCQWPEPGGSDSESDLGVQPGPEWPGASDVGVGVHWQESGVQLEAAETRRVAKASASVPTGSLPVSKLNFNLKSTPGQSKKRKASSTSEPAGGGSEKKLATAIASASGGTTPSAGREVKPSRPQAPSQAASQAALVEEPRRAKPSSGRRRRRKHGCTFCSYFARTAWEVSCMIQAARWYLPVVTVQLEVSTAHSTHSGCAHKHSGWPLHCDHCGRSVCMSVSTPERGRTSAPTATTGPPRWATPASTSGGTRA